MKQIKFVNEIGNNITIKIKNKNGYATNYKTKDKIKYIGCEIIMKGPTSISTNEITMDEAKQLYNMLKEYLKDN